MINYQGYSTLEILEGLKHYNHWIASQVLPYIKEPVLEVGAGTGNISKEVLKHHNLYLSDNDKGLLLHLKKTIKTKKDIFTWDITKNPPRKYKNFFKSIFGINVLEHIKSDTNALTNIHSALKKNGMLILLVPAKQFAYSRLDKELGHYRRYEKEELEKKLKKAGFVIEKMYFFNILGLFSWYIREKVERKQVHFKQYHISLFDMIVPILRTAESVVKPPLGISLIVIAKKL